ncbi:TPA: Lrp/AsnC family transcriptional regulator [Candidatus Micrarchaeota archaeon]|nr:Lrp/AsnC family transcriptional regulator [Candidatus Micrarchaeota archaeon]
MAELKLDDKDFDILAALRENSRQSVIQLARKTRIPPTTIHNRVKKLRESGVIEGYGIRLNKEKMGFSTCALVSVFLDNNLLETSSKKGGLAERLFKHPRVDEVFETTGSVDIIVKVLGKDIKEITDTVINHIREVKGVARTETVIALSNRQK